MMRVWMSLIAALCLFFMQTLSLAAPDDLTTRKLKEALMDSQKSLGELEPWQKKVFEVDVLPQYSRFVRDYRRSKNVTSLAVQADIDTTGLKRYLKFTAGSGVPLFLKFQIQPNCKPCLEAQAGIKKVIQERVFARGFAWSETDTPAGNQLLVSILEATPDEEDTAHADEKKYEFKLALQLAGLGGAGQVEGSQEMLEAVNFEPVASKLLTDLYFELGSRVEAGTLGVGTKLIGGSQPLPILLGVTVEVAGFRDFAHYSDIKAKLKSSLELAHSSSSQNVVLSEFKFSKSSVIFRVQGFESQDQVKMVLAESATGRWKAPRLSDIGGLYLEVTQ